MTGQVCRRCGAASIGDVCALCGLPTDAASQPTPSSPPPFVSFDPATDDTDPDLPVVPGPGLDMTLPAAPTPPTGAGVWSTPPPAPPSPASWNPAPAHTPFLATPGAAAHGAPAYGEPTHPTPTYAVPGYAPTYGAQQSAVPGYYASQQPAGSQHRHPSGGRQLVWVIAVVAAVILTAGAIVAAIGVWGPIAWIGVGRPPSVISKAPAETTAQTRPASTVTVTVAPQVPITTRTTTRPSSPPQTRTTTQAGQAVTSLPGGTWITILESLPKNQTTLAEAQARAAGIAGPKVSVIDSDTIPGLNGGYWALGVAGHASRESAVAMCGSFGREAGGSCYPREVG